MMRFLVVVSLLLPTAVAAEEFSGLKQTDCQSAFFAVSSIERSIMPLTSFNLLVANQQPDGSNYFDQIKDKASEIEGRIEASYALISDLCSAEDFDELERQIIGQPALSRENCDTEIEALRPDIVRPLSTLEELRADLANPDFSAVSGQMFFVHAEIEKTADYYTNEFMVAVQLCRYVQTQ
ncbi:hypothetical protein [uncultured Ruegeria sp.]|uniref:hypothetical protein n=1 Tax=uncultured Ruegeria sp. TaxID=259304 RepID=UPI002608D5D8|nr:hypothetical protein [uncultured Ruegeria sp.]